MARAKIIFVPLRVIEIDLNKRIRIWRGRQDIQLSEGSIASRHRSAGQEGVRVRRRSSRYCKHPATQDLQWQVRENSRG
jgi:hypothetical protein